MLVQNHLFPSLTRAVAGAYSRKRAALTALGSILGFVLVANSSWIASPDSALYLELGESLAGGKGYVFNGEPHTYVPPGYPLIIAAVVKVFGNGFGAYRLLMSVMGLVAAALGLLLAVRLFGRDAGLLAGGVFALNHVLLQNSTLATSDVHFAVIVLAGLNALVSAGARERPSGTWILAAALTIGLAPLVRVNGWGVPPAAAIYLLSRWPREGWASRIIWVGAFLAICVLPVAIWDLWRSPQPLSFSEGSYFNAVSERSIYDQLQVIADSLLNYVPEMSYALTGVAAKDVLLEFVVPALVLLGWITALKEGELLLVPLTAIQFGGLLLSSAGSRYLIFLLPGLYVFFAAGLLEFYTWIASRLHGQAPDRSRAGHLIIGSFIVLAVLNVGHNVKTVVQSRTALEVNGAENARSLPFFEAARWLKSRDPQAVVMTMPPRVLRYLSGCPTVELIRSGVPEREALVMCPQRIQGLLDKRKPKYLFSDSKNEVFFRSVMRGLRSAGVRLEEIPLPSGGDRFKLWRLAGLSVDIEGSGTNHKGQK